MKKRNRLIPWILIAAMMLTACGGAGESENVNQESTVSSDTLYVQKVENLPEDFIMGMDASCVAAREKGGVK